MKTAPLWFERILASHFLRRAERRQAKGEMAAAHKDLARAARAGCAPAQHALARAYQVGQGCARSGALARRWYQTAAESGYVDAQFELGLLLLRDSDLHSLAGGSARWLSVRGEHEEELISALFPGVFEIRSDPVKAFSWLLRAAEAGKAEAQANVGWLLLRGHGCEKDHDQAKRWLVGASAHNISQAALGLSEYYLSDGAERSYEASVQWAKKSSDLGNGSGSYLCGVAFRDGAGVEQNSTEAERYFAIASEQGHPTAAYDEAILAIGREPDASEMQGILERLRRTAKRGHVPSMVLLAQFYGTVNGIMFDSREAAHWYRSAADLGDTNSQFLAGCLYARGEGVVHDLKHAVRYFELAGKAGHAQAAFNLGVMRLNGQGIDQDIMAAKRWFSVAAQAGLPQAQLCLGQILYREALTPADVEVAQSFINDASVAGYAEAKLALAKIYLEKGDTSSQKQAETLLKEAMYAGEVEACELLIKMPRAGGADGVVQVLERRVREGNTRAKFVLGELMLTGVRAPREVVAALALLGEAAREGDPRAHFLLGVSYCQGVHSVKDLRHGYGHYLAAARLGHPIAQYNAGIMLAQGLGIEKDYDAGLDWIKLAGSNHVPAAIEFIDSIERKSASEDAEVRQA